MARFSDTVADTGEGTQHHQKFGYFLGKIDALEESAGEYIGNEQNSQSRHAKNENGHLQPIDCRSNVLVDFLKSSLLVRIVTFVIHCINLRYN